MALILRDKKPQDLYLRELQTLVDFGEPIDVRGRKTIEILDVISEVQEPWHHCILIPSRRWNPWLALSEALWILAGRDDVAAIVPYNSHIVDYSDDGVHLYGAYGKRIYDQIDDLIERLRNDPSDRRAVLQIWDNAGLRLGPEHTNTVWYEDLTAQTKDPPCNNMLYFKLRNDKLHMTVICRSNDIHYGLFAVNLPTFGILQEYIAARLGVGIGHQTHISNSLHVYTDDERAVEITDRMLYKESDDRLAYPEHELAFGNLTWIQSHEEFAMMCSEVLDDNIQSLKSYPNFLIWASYFLKQYREHKWEPLSLPLLGFQDWVLAGQLFVDKVWQHARV